MIRGRLDGLSRRCVPPRTLCQLHQIACLLPHAHPSMPTPCAQGLSATYEEMVEADVKPSDVTFLHAFQALSNCFRKRGVEGGLGCWAMEACTLTM
jgi:hypothetical protein